MKTPPLPIALVLWGAFVLFLPIWLAWRVGAVVGVRLSAPEVRLALAASEDFYSSPQWKAIVASRHAINRARNFGFRKCECCGTRRPAAWHVDHVYPRSTHPECALSLPDTQLYCDVCNMAKGNRFIGRGPRSNWQRNPRLRKRTKRRRAA